MTNVVATEDDLLAIAALLRPPAWHRHAACAGMDAPTFFPEKGHSALVARAKAVCARCPVREPCLAWALDHGEVHGVWGGSTPEQRKRLPGWRGRPRQPLLKERRSG